MINPSPVRAVSRRRLLVAFRIALTSATVFAAEPASEKKPTKELELVQYVQHDDLSNICDIDVNSYGKHLYTAAFNPGAVAQYSIDPESRKLTFVGSIRDRQLHGTVDVKIFPDGTQAVAASCFSASVTLFHRNPETGKLTITDTLTSGERDTLGLRWPSDVAVSPDSRFVYVSDSRAPGRAINPDKNKGAITILRPSEGKLHFVEANIGENDCFGGSRCVLCHPDGRLLFTMNHKANTLVVCERDTETGRIRIQQVFRHGVDGVKCLEGAMICALSPDHRFLYTNAGNFELAGGVGVFEIDSEGKLTLVQQYVDGTDGFVNFKGGNKIVVGPYGDRVYATATGSGSLAIFSRDLNTGRLKHLETMVTGKNGVNLRGANGMAFDKAGEFLYVACEHDKGIAVMKIGR
ncbi:MAG: lactonase family protein [Planctomycetaceae bacterium]